VSLSMEGAAYGARPLPEAVMLARTWAQKAIETDPTDADAQSIFGSASLYAGDYEDALQRTAIAIASNPNSYWAHATRGATLIWSGRTAEGRDAMLHAERLSPHDPSGALHPTVIAASYFLDGDYAGAVLMTKRVISRYADYPLPYRWLAAALGKLGRIDEARTALQQALAIAPNVLALYVNSRPPWFRPESYEDMLDGLRKAGWQG
jgi:adenylate cyclase